MGTSKNSSFQARQGASKKLRRSICLICKEQFFASERFLHPKGVSNAVWRHN